MSQQLATVNPQHPLPPVRTRRPTAAATRSRPLVPGAGLAAMISVEWKELKPPVLTRKYLAGYLGAIKSKLPPGATVGVRRQGDGLNRTCTSTAQTCQPAGFAAGVASALCLLLSSQSPAACLPACQSPAHQLNSLPAWLPGCLLSLLTAGVWQPCRRSPPTWTTPPGWPQPQDPATVTTAGAALGTRTFTSASCCKCSPPPTAAPAPARMPPPSTMGARLATAPAMAGWW